MMLRRALVTGATGFVGRCVVDRLLANGWVVHIVVRPESKLGLLASAMQRVAVHRQDATIDAARAIVREARPDVVFHLASVFVSEHQPSDVERMIESNVKFGALIVEAMYREGAKCLVNTGTHWQHFQGRGYSPVNLYAATKQAFESLLQYYVEACGLRAITLELSDTYGAGDPRKKLLNLLLDSARTGNELHASPGEQAIDLVHVEDVARAYLKAAELVLSPGHHAHERFRVSSSAPIGLRALVHELERALGITVPVVWGARTYRPREVMSPWQGIPALPEWEPQIPLGEGLKGLR